MPGAPLAGAGGRPPNFLARSLFERGDLVQPPAGFKDGRVDTHPMYPASRGLLADERVSVDALVAHAATSVGPRVTRVGRPG